MKRLARLRTYQQSLALQRGSKQHRILKAKAKREEAERLRNSLRSYHLGRMEQIAAEKRKAEGTKTSQNLSSSSSSSNQTKTQQGGGESKRPKATKEGKSGTSSGHSKTPIQSGEEEEDEGSVIEMDPYSGPVTDIPANKLAAWGSGPERRKSQRESRVPERIGEVVTTADSLVNSEGIRRRG